MSALRCDRCDTNSLRCVSLLVSPFVSSSSLPPASFLSLLLATATGHGRLDLLAVPANASIGSTRTAPAPATRPRTCARPRRRGCRPRAWRGRKRSVVAFVSRFADWSSPNDGCCGFARRAPSALVGSESSPAIAVQAMRTARPDWASAAIPGIFLRGSAAAAAM